MRTLSHVSCCGCRRGDSERNEDLIGVLMAISIVSRRLAAKLAAMERRETEKLGGRECYEKTGGNRRDYR